MGQIITLCLLFILSIELASSQANPISFSLKSRGGSAQRRSIRRRGLSSANVPLVDFFNGTDLQWYGPVSVGTPPQNFTVVFDTGSQQFEIPDSSCSTCTNQRKFDSSKSSTFKNLNQPGNLTFATGVGVDPVIGNNYQLLVNGVEDVISVGGLTATASFDVILQQSPTFDRDPFDGIMGMAPIEGNFFAALTKQGLPAKFGFLLSPNNTGGAEMTIGGVDQSKYNSSTLMSVKVNATEGFWRLNALELYVNGKTSASLGQELDMVFDSGTSNLVFQQDVAEAIYALISSSIKPYTAEAGTYGIPCNELSSLPAQIDLTLPSTSGGSFNITIPSSELSVGPFSQNSSMCQTLINAWTVEFPFGIIGASLLKHYYTVWDLENQEIGFAQPCNNCSAPGAPGSGSGSGGQGSAIALRTGLFTLMVRSGILLGNLVFALL